MPSKLSIKELELLSGIKAHTLRIWEQRYGILKPERTETNIRYYNNTDLKRVLNISLLNNNGYKISKIAELSDTELIKEAEKFLNTFDDENHQIESLIMCLMDLNDERFEKTINNSVMHFGFENTIEKIIFPFFRKLGNMWQVGMVNPAQEHYLSNLIRQKIIVGIDKLTPNNVSSPKTVLLFLPNGELHEMGLLYTNFLFKSRGYRCIYLGQSVPLEDVIAISKSIKPDLAVSIVTSKIPDIEINAYLQLLADSLPEVKFLLSGRMVMDGNESFDLPTKKFELFDDFQHLRSII
jgi:MerR family transcriptional regulator, light-induced transcriptional regulator